MMDKNSILHYKSVFDGVEHYIESDDASEQIEVWFARELQTILGYARWENFMVAIDRAVASCKSLGVNVDDHFREVTKMIEIGKGGKREVSDFMLTAMPVTSLRKMEIRRKRRLLLHKAISQYKLERRNS